MHRPGPRGTPTAGTSSRVAEKGWIEAHNHEHICDPRTSREMMVGTKSVLRASREMRGDFHLLRIRKAEGRICIHFAKNHRPEVGEGTANIYKYEVLLPCPVLKGTISSHQQVNHLRSRPTGGVVTGKPPDPDILWNKICCTRRCWDAQKKQVK
jgi:hypothetical protein